MGVARPPSQSSVADAVAMLMLRKSLDLQQSAAAQLIASVSPATRARPRRIRRSASMAEHLCLASVVEAQKKNQPRGWFLSADSARPTVGRVASYAHQQSRLFP